MHGGLGARGTQPDLVEHRVRLAQLIGKRDFSGGGGSETRTVVNRRRGGGHHDGVRMTHDQRAPRADEIKESISIFVVQPAPLATGDEDRVSLHRCKRPHRGIDPARDPSLGILNQGRRA